MLWKVQNFLYSQKANNAQKNAANEDESRCANGIKLKWHQSEIMVQLNEEQAGQFDHRQSRAKKNRKNNSHHPKYPIKLEQWAKIKF